MSIKNALQHLPFLFVLFCFGFFFFFFVFLFVCLFVCFVLFFCFFRILAVGKIAGKFDNNSSIAEIASWLNLTLRDQVQSKLPRMAYYSPILRCQLVVL